MPKFESPIERVRPRCTASSIFCRHEILVRCDHVIPVATPTISIPSTFRHDRLFHTRSSRWRRNPANYSRLITIWNGNKSQFCGTVHLQSPLQPDTYQKSNTRQDYNKDIIVPSKARSHHRKAQKKVGKKHGCPNRYVDVPGGQKQLDSLHWLRSFSRQTPTQTKSNSFSFKNHWLDSLHSQRSFSGKRQDRQKLKVPPLKPSTSSRGSRFLSYKNLRVFLRPITLCPASSIRSSGSKCDLRNFLQNPWNYCQPAFCLFTLGRSENHWTVKPHSSTRDGRYKITSILLWWT